MGCGLIFTCEGSNARYKNTTMATPRRFGSGFRAPEKPSEPKPPAEPQLSPEQQSTTSSRDSREFKTVSDGSASHGNATVTHSFDEGDG